MALPTFCRDSITVVRPGIKKSRGTVIKDWDTATEHVIKNVSVQATSSNTTYDTREGVVIRATAYLPPNSDIAAGDLVKWHGYTFAIDGDPLPVYSPTGALNHVKATLIDWRG